MINKFWFRNQNQLMVIFAKDVGDAFNSWKRVFGGRNDYQSEFERILIDEPADNLQFLYLTGDSLTKEETLNIINKKEIKFKTSKVEIKQIQLVENKMEDYFE